MKLQTNDSGTWRNLINFHKQDKEAVMVHAERLAELQTTMVKLQITDIDRNVVAYWTPGTGWKGEEYQS